MVLLRWLFLIVFARNSEHIVLHIFGGGDGGGTGDVDESVVFF